MDNNIIQRAVDTLDNYYMSLYDAAIPTFKMDDDMRALYIDLDLYYNTDEYDARMKAFYFYYEIIAPLFRVRAILCRNASIPIQKATLPAEYRLSHSEVAALLKTRFTRCRELILDSIRCHSSDYENLKVGIMESDGCALQKVSQDLTNHYMLLEFANRVSQLYSGGSDEVIAAIYRPGEDAPFSDDAGTEALSFNEMRNLAKRYVVDFWKTADRYSAREKAVVESVIKSDIFRPFREDCCVLYQNETGQRPMRPYRKQVSQASTIISTQQNDVLSGVRKLAEYLPASVTKAQEILNSGILQEAGISYRIGNKHIINREKLDEFRKNNPNAFANLPKKKG